MNFHFHAPTEELYFNKKMDTEQCKFIKKNHVQCKNRVCIGLPFCHIHREQKLNVCIKKSNIPNSGVGLFACDDDMGDKDVIFRNGDKICPYSGEIINLEELERRYGEFTAPYGIMVKNNQIYEDGALRRGIGSLINHFPSKANCRFSVAKNNRINIVATKNIYNNKELYISYGRAYKMSENGVETSTNRNVFKV